MFGICVCVCVRYVFCRILLISKTFFFVLYPVNDALLRSTVSSTLELRSHKINFYSSWQKLSHFTFPSLEFSCCRDVAWKECVSTAIENEHHVSFNIIFISFLFQNLLNDICRSSRVQGMSIIFYALKWLQQGNIVLIIYCCDR